MFKKLFLDAPNIGENEKKYINEALETGYVSTVGPFVPKFEEKFSQYLGSKTAISTQSGTAAVHMALYELGIGKNDEVIVPALTFIATVNPVQYVGAKPVFADVDANTWNIDPTSIIEKITEKTKAIIPVHLYGNPCEMDKIMDIADKRGIHVIEDATESLGALYKGKHTGTFGSFGCFSFNGNKTITTGGGGMVVGQNSESIKHIRMLVNQGRDEECEGYFHPEVGFNYRMTNIEAALGLAQIERIEDLLDKKRRIHSVYETELKGVDEICFQTEYEAAKSSWWLTCACFREDIDVIRLQMDIKKEGIATRRVFTPVTKFPPYTKYNEENMKNSKSIHERGLCFPSSTLNAEEDVHLVCQKIKKLLSKSKK